MLAALYAALREVGLSSCGYTLHSLSRGEASDIQPLLTSDNDICVFGKWKSYASKGDVADHASYNTSLALKALTTSKGLYCAW